MHSRRLLNLFLASLIAISVKVQAQSPTAAAHRFNIFVKGDLVLHPNETEGPIAVGGNLITDQYQISFNKNHGAFFVGGQSIGLAVRGGVNLRNGQVHVNGDNYVKIGQCAPSNDAVSNLKIWYKDRNNAFANIRITKENGDWDSQPMININASVNTFGGMDAVNANPICENIFGTGSNQIDVDGAFTKMIQRSGHLRDLADNLPIRNQNGGIIDGAALGPYSNPQKFDQNPKIIVDPNKLNVLTVTAKVWNSINNINFEGVPEGPQLGTTEEQYASSGKKFGLVINIIDFPTFCAENGGNNTIKFPNVGGLGDSKGSTIIYNFPDATKGLSVGGSVIFGTIFAPQADLIKRNNGNINGQIIAKSFEHNGDEIHFWPFVPNIPEPIVKAISITASTKCFKDAPYLDYNVTPNYDATGETAKIEWINSEGKVVQEDNGQQLSGSILFPGAAVDIDGKGMAWPGYQKVGTKWEEIPGDRYGSLREDGATIRITVSPTETVSITYPPSITGCYTSPPPGTVLPVTLASFTAENVNCDVQLKWVVSESKNFSHFVVQRSIDAKNFVPVQRINFNAAVTEYSYADSPVSRESTPSKNYYYRLQQVDNDETFEFSAIKNVSVGTCDARLSVDFYPNPTQDQVFVKSFSPVKKLEIFTLGGKQVYSVMPNQNETELKVNVQAFAQGLYIVNVVNAEGKYSSKILKK